MLVADCPPERIDRDSVTRLIEGEVIPRVEGERDFRGVWFFLDPTGGKLFSITLYETEEDLCAAQHQGVARPDFGSPGLHAGERRKPRDDRRKRPLRGCGAGAADIARSTPTVRDARPAGDAAKGRACHLVARPRSTRRYPALLTG